jgi:hypothetical protein
VKIKAGNVIDDAIHINAGSNGQKVETQFNQSIQNQTINTSVNEMHEASLHTQLLAPE